MSAAMPPVQGSQASISSTDPQPGQYPDLPAQQETPVRKRRRTTNSCAGCRKRKSRCDRRQPCSECVTNATLDLCQYLDDAAKPHPVAVRAWQNTLAQPPAQVLGHAQTPARSRQSHESVDEDQSLVSRVSQLENLIRDHMAILNQPQSSLLPILQRPAGPVTPPETTSGTSPQEDQVHFTGTGRLPGHLVGKNGCETKFVPGKHWTSLLYMFSELQLLKNRPKNDPFPQIMSQTLDKFRHLIPKTKAIPLPMLVPSLSVDIAIRSLLPPRSVANALVHLYVGSFEKLHRILHVPIFFHELDQFWMAPSAGDLNWTATLIVVLRLGLLIRPQIDELSIYGSHEWISRMETQSLQLVELFLHITTNSVKPSLETLQTQCLVVLARMSDGSRSSIPWKGVGELLQTGILMGLNHDPSLFVDPVSMYDGEMRRRIWTSILELHISCSRTSGLPFLISSSQCNIRKPLNNNDISITPCATEIPATEHWQKITDTSFQHVLAGSLALRSQLGATPAILDGTLTPGEHCIACQTRKSLQPVNSPFDSHDAMIECPSVHSLQHVYLEMVAECSFLKADQFSSIPLDHARELLHGCCRAILKLHQHPDLDEVKRFLIARWFRNDILTAIISLCLALRASQGAVREDLIPWKLEQGQEAATLQLIENSLLLFARPWQPTWNEVEEQVLLIIILCIGRGNGANGIFMGDLVEKMQMFEPQILDDNSQQGPTFGSEPRNRSTLTSGDANVGFHEVHSSFLESFDDDRINMSFDFDTFMADLGLDTNC